MIAKTQLAMLDYNCGSNNTQVTTKDGKRKKISETKDREYIHELLSSTLEASPDITGDKLPRIGSILPNISPIDKPDKEEAIENMKTRFKI